jgi:hypothetical protein
MSVAEVIKEPTVKFVVLKRVKVAVPPLRELPAPPAIRV